MVRPGRGPTKQERLQQAFLYLVTPVRPKAGKLEYFLPKVLAAGVDVVQLREKNMEAGLLLEHCATVRRLTSDYGALFFVNDRVDVAIAAGADGVHLGQGDLPVSQAQGLTGDKTLIGLSTHSEQEVTGADGAGAAYFAVGPVYATPTKPGRKAVGLGLPRFAASTASVPFFAIGGINLDNLSAVLEAGAGRVAVLRAVTDAKDPADVAQKMKFQLVRASESRGP